MFSSHNLSGCFICLDSSSVRLLVHQTSYINTYLMCKYIYIYVNMYLLLFNNLCCCLSLPPYGSKLLLMLCLAISSAQLFAIRIHS